MINVKARLRSLEQPRIVWSNLPPGARILILATVVFGIWVAFWGHVLDNTPVGDYVRGGTADWLVTREAWSGGDPYAPLDQLAEQHLGWQGTEPTDPHPRPPSALLILGPLGLSPSQSAIRVLAAFSALALSVWVVATARLLRLSPIAEFLVVPLAVVAPSMNSVIWGSHIPIVAAFLGLGFMKDTRVARAGGIALASGLKLFPFLLAFAEKRHPIRVAALAGSMLAGLTAVGLLLPGVQLSEALSAIVGAPGAYGTIDASDVNLSLNGTIGWAPGSVVFPILGVVVVLAGSRYLSKHGAIALALFSMVLFAPYAWPEYMILWFPALIYLWKLATPARLAVLVYVIVVVTARGGTTFMMTGVALALTLLVFELWFVERQPVEAAGARL